MNETKRANIKRYYETHKTSYRKMAKIFRCSHTSIMNAVRAK